MHPIITLLSDFGLKDPYVAEMKGTIMNISPEARIIDISHKVEKFDTRMGAFLLASAAPHFPQGTIHVAVVDPGVGTKRRPILVETSSAFLVGPDNGVLMLAVQQLGEYHVFKVTNQQLMRPQVSDTFHGRDIFAPVAANLANGCKPIEFGPEIHDFIVPKFAKPSVKGRKVLGEVLHIDDFGNVISNIHRGILEKMQMQKSKMLQIKLGKTIYTLKWCSAYGEVPKGVPLVLIGSRDSLEIAVNQGSAVQRFQAKIGDPVTISIGQTEVETLN